MLEIKKIGGSIVEIISKIKITGRHEEYIVLAHIPGKKEYVTWQTDGVDYYWGHYFSYRHQSRNEALIKAFRDVTERAGIPEEVIT